MLEVLEEVRVDAVSGPLPTPAVVVRCPAAALVGRWPRARGPIGLVGLVTILVVRGPQLAVHNVEDGATLLRSAPVGDVAVNVLQRAQQSGDLSNCPAKGVRLQ